PDDRCIQNRLRPIRNRTGVAVTTIYGSSEPYDLLTAVAVSDTIHFACCLAAVFARSVKQRLIGGRETAEAAVRRQLIGDNTDARLSHVRGILAMDVVLCVGIRGTGNCKRD